MCYRSIPFSKLGCRTVWTELLLNKYTLVHSPRSEKTGGGCETFVAALQSYIFKIGVQNHLDGTTFKTIYPGTRSSLIKTWWWMRKMCSRIAAFHFENQGQYRLD